MIWLNMTVNVNNKSKRDASLHLLCLFSIVKSLKALKRLTISLSHLVQEPLYNSKLLKIDFQLQIFHSKGQHYFQKNNQNNLTFYSDKC